MLLFMLGNVVQFMRNPHLRILRVKHVIGGLKCLVLDSLYIATLGISEVRLANIYEIHGRILRTSEFRTILCIRLIKCTIRSIDFKLIPRCLSEKDLSISITLYEIETWRIVGDEEGC